MAELEVAGPARTGAADGGGRARFRTLARQLIGPGKLPVTVGVLLVLAVPQLYLLPEGLIDVPLSTFWTLLLAPGVLLCVLRTPDRALLRDRLVQVLLALLGIRVAALLWSPEPRAGLQSIIVLGQFLLSIALFVRLTRLGAEPLRRIQRWYWPWVLAEVALVLLFRFQPGIEDAFLRSVGGFFAGQNTVAALYADRPNNVFDDAKSGGVFVNANVAAMFLGVNGLAGLALASITGSRWARLVGVAALVAVPFTGSKSATVLVVVLPALAFAAYRLRRGMTAVVRRTLLGAAAGLVALGIAVLVVNRSFLDALVEAFVVRTEIWQYGAEAFGRTPLLGLGYGGWDIGFGRYALEHDIYRVFPPHNLLLAAWAVTGVVGLALTLGYVGFVARAVVRGGRLGVPDRFVAYAGAALAWTVIQGMGENTDIFGDIHFIPIVALLIAYLIRPGLRDRPDGEEPSGDDPAADRGDPAAPAVPAVGDLHREPGAGAADLPAAAGGEGSGSRQHPPG
ncbi:O-antigen ligase family protein [Plantactinospora sp. WMMC1484]|uniref:O-antigen ligase family protein n=1 Tax=Plantactinospora sp. WMMC1484 TaxID=3404122 RepID=UPI003BF4DA59